VLRLSKEFRDAAERSNYADVLRRAREIVTFIADGQATASRDGTGMSCGA